MASYTWETEADIFLSMTDQECIDKVTPAPILKMNLAKEKYNDKVVVCHIVIYGD